jgi:alpha-amylase
MRLGWFGLCAIAALVACQSGMPAGETSNLEPGLDTQSVSSASADTWRRQVIYLALPDRFYDGNASNNNLGQANCFDKNNATKFHGGDFNGMQQKLGYIKDLGTTALWLTPVYKQVGIVNGNSCGYHGYWPDFTNPSSSAVEPKFGTSTELSSLINTARGTTYNMKFIMDMVVNHAGYGASVVSSNPSWFHGNCSGDEINCPLAGLPDFRQEDSSVATYLTNLSKAWASSYALDGIRMDTAKHVPLSYWQNSWIPGVNASRSGMFLLAEAFLDSNANQIKPYYDAGFDSAFNFSLRRGLVDTFAKAGSVDILAGRVADYVGTLGLDRALLTVNLLDNHDVQRFVNEPGFGVSEADIRRRYKLALGALLTLPGIPQIYYGNELGMYGGNDPDNRKDMPSWAWTDAGRNAPQSGYLGGSSGDNTPKATYDFVKRMIGVRKNNTALWKGYYAEMWRQNGSGANVYAFYRGSGTNRFVVVFNNGTLSSGNIGIPIAANTGINQTDRTALQNATFDDQAGYCATATISASNGTLNVNLPGQCVAVYKAR